MEEVWKDIKNYKGFYQVSNLGRVKSLLFQNNVYNKKYPREKILKFKGQTYETGYRVDLWKNGNHKTILVARLVAFTFYNKNINNHKLTVNHKDGNRFNNNIDNLELISLADNIRHAFKTGLMKKKCKIVKLIDKQTNVANNYNCLREASCVMGYNGGYISNKLKRSIYENEKYKWELL